MTNKKEKVEISTMQNQEKNVKKAIVTGDSANMLRYICLGIGAVGILLLLLVGKVKRKGSK